MDRHSEALLRLKSIYLDTAMAKGILDLIRLLNIASENFVEFVDQTLCFLMKEILINIMFQQAL